MTEFIPIEIIARRKDPDTTPAYIIRVLDMITFKVYTAMAPESGDQILEFDLTPLEVLNDYVDYKSGNKFRPHLISELISPASDGSSEATTDLLYEDTKIYHFDRSRPSMQSINYSLKRDKKLFVPCFFKHPDHDLIEAKWGRHTESAAIGPDLKIPGYIVTSKKEFDKYITKVEVLSSRYNPEEYKNILMTEFKDYLHSLGEDPDSLVCKFKSGKELELKLDE